MIQNFLCSKAVLTYCNCIAFSDAVIQKYLLNRCTACTCTCILWTCTCTCTCIVGTYIIKCLSFPMCVCVGITETKACKHY